VVHVVVEAVRAIGNAILITLCVYLFAVVKVLPAQLARHARIIVQETNGVHTLHPVLHVQEHVELVDHVVGAPLTVVLQIVSVIQDVMQTHARQVKHNHNLVAIVLEKNTVQEVRKLEHALQIVLGVLGLPALAPAALVIQVVVLSVGQDTTRNLEDAKHV